MLHFINYISFLTSYQGKGAVNRVEDIGYIIQGYLMAAQDSTIEDFMLNFSHFICNKLNIEDTIEWSKVIRFNSDSDAHSLQLFELFFKDYVASFE